MLQQRAESADATRPAEPTTETPAPVIERGWALRRKDDPAVFAFIEFGAQIGRTKALSQIQLWAYVEAAFSWLPPPARLEWEPVYVTRAVSVTISPEEPAEERP